MLEAAAAVTDLAQPTRDAVAGVDDTAVRHRRLRWLVLVTGRRCLADRACRTLGAELEATTLPTGLARRTQHAVAWIAVRCAIVGIADTRARTGLGRRATIKAEPLVTKLTGGANDTIARIKRVLTDLRIETDRERRVAVRV